MVQSEKKAPVERPFLKNQQSLIDSVRKVEYAASSKKDFAPEDSLKPRGTTTGLNSFAGKWDESTAAHLLRRTLFGVRHEELQQFKLKSLAESVDELIRTSPLPSPPINEYNREGVEDPDVAFGDSWIYAPYHSDFEGERIVSLKTWMVNNRITQETTIQEKMVLFWHNLLATKAWDVFVSKASYQYVNMLHLHAIGNFKSLIKALTLDPAMLYFLNGAQNNKYAPDENYGRELQELFCIGKGSGSQYTEGDVQAAARLLTGFTVSWEDVMIEGEVKSYFYPDFHDTEDKVFSSFYGNRVIKGREGEAGAEELDELLDMIFDNDETALYLCRRLYNFFVYSDIDDSVESMVIEPLAQVLRNNNYDIAPVLKVLFASEHFYDESNRGAMIKNPADNLIGFWRSMNLAFNEDPQAIYTAKQKLLWLMSGQGMEVADPPSVSGWLAYYQAPQYDKSWITTDTITSRSETINSFLAWGAWIDENNKINADLLSFIDQFESPEIPAEMLSEASVFLLGLPMSEEALDYLKGILLSGQQSDSYWTVAWGDYKNDPSNDTFKQIVETRLKNTFQAMCQLGEFQLM